jgi:hypothetical protein
MIIILKILKVKISLKTFEMNFQIFKMTIPLELFKMIILLKIIKKTIPTCKININQGPLKMKYPLIIFQTTIRNLKILINPKNHIQAENIMLKKNIKITWHSLKNSKIVKREFSIVSIYKCNKMITTYKVKITLLKKLICSINKKSKMKVLIYLIDS